MGNKQIFVQVITNREPDIIVIINHTVILEIPWKFYTCHKQTLIFMSVFVVLKK